MVIMVEMTRLAADFMESTSCRDKIVVCLDLRSINQKGGVALLAAGRISRPRLDRSAGRPKGSDRTRGRINGGRALSGSHEQAANDGMVSSRNLSSKILRFANLCLVFQADAK